MTRRLTLFALLLLAATLFAEGDAARARIALPEPDVRVTAWARLAEGGLVISGTQGGRVFARTEADVPRTRPAAAHTDAVSALAVHRASGRIVSAGRDGRLVLMNAAGKIIRAHQLPNDAVATALAFFPADTRALAVGTDEGELYFFLLDDDRFQRRAQLTSIRHRGAVRAISWSRSANADEAVLATAGDDGRVLISASPDAPPVEAKTGANAPPVLALAWFSDTLLAVGDAEGVTHLVNAKGDLRGRIAAGANEDGVTTLAWTADRGLAVGRASGRIESYRVQSPKRPARLSANPAGHLGAVRLLYFNAAGKLFSAGDDDVLLSWSFENGAQLPPNYIALRDSGTGLAWSGNSRLLAVSAGGAGYASGLRFFAANGTAARRPFLDSESDARAVSLAPNGALAAYVSASGRLTILNATSRVVARARAHPGGAHTIAFRPDGREIVTAGSDGAMRFWSPSGKLLATLTRKQGGAAGTLAWRRDGKRLATAGWDKLVRLRSARGKRIGKPLRGHTQPILTLDWSADGRLLASAGRDNTVRLWDGRTGRSLGVIRGHVDWIPAVSFHPSRPLLASCDWTGALRLWRVSPNEKPRRAGGPWRVLRDKCSGMAWSPDGKQLAIVGRDQLLRLLPAKAIVK